MGRRGSGEGPLAGACTPSDRSPREQPKKHLTHHFRGEPSLPFTHEDAQLSHQQENVMNVIYICDKFKMKVEIPLYESVLTDLKRRTSGQNCFWFLWNGSHRTGQTGRRNRGDGAALLSEGGNRDPPKLDAPSLAACSSPSPEPHLPLLLLCTWKLAFPRRRHSVDS